VVVAAAMQAATMLAAAVLVQAYQTYYFMVTGL
jgi:hypothetical protein